MLNQSTKITTVALAACLVIAMPSSGIAADSHNNSLLRIGDHKNTQSLVTSWNGLKFKGIERQQYDYSCGAASMATLVNNLYGESYSEADILDMAGNEGDSPMSMADMKSVAEMLGLTGKGLVLSALDELTLMVIVHLQPKIGDYEHFSVVESVSSKSVTLADSSWGRRTYPLEEFMDMWLIHDEKNGSRTGRIFAVLPPEDMLELVKDSLKPARPLFPEHVRRHGAIQAIFLQKH